MGFDSNSLSKKEESEETTNDHLLQQVESGFEFELKITGLYRDFKIISIIKYFEILLASKRYMLKFKVSTNT